MNHTVHYRLSNTILLCFLCISDIVSTVFYVRLASTTAQPGTRVVVWVMLTLAVFASLLLVDRLIRLVARIGCFRITSDGIAHLPVELRLLFFRLPISVRQVPWQCIRTIRLERINNRPYISFSLVDEADFPKGYSLLVRYLLEHGQRSDVYALQVDVTYLLEDPAELTKRLQELLKEFQAANNSSL